MKGSNKKLRVVIIIGPPGSGKGTQAELLQKKFGVEYIGSGDLLRDRMKKNDYTGNKIKGKLTRGEIIPTSIIFKIWMNKFELFKQKPKLNGFIMDGSPRKVFEAELVDEALKWYGWDKNKKVIFIDISPKEVINRLTKRRICQKCGRLIPYVGEFKKLKKCDKCGGKLIRRFDDNLNDIKERMSWYKTEVLPVVKYYQRKKELIRINGEQSIENVFRDVLKTVQKK